MPRLLAGNPLGVEAIWQHRAPSVWSRRIANLPLLTCRHGQIPAPDGSSSAQCFAQPSLPPMCRSGAPFSGDITEPCHGAHAHASIEPDNLRLPLARHAPEHRCRRLQHVALCGIALLIAGQRRRRFIAWLGYFRRCTTVVSVSAGSGVGSP